MVLSDKYIYEQILEVSQTLDKLIVNYYKDADN